MRFEPYEDTLSTPNVVVDGSANAATVLTLSHWPQAPAPPGLEADLSAQMALRYVAEGHALHGDAEVVTNNHFDQDGLVSAFALVDPETAVDRQDLLEDLAAAGDFAIYRDRRAARASMVIAAYGDPARSPIRRPGEEDPTGLLYQELLPRLPELLDDLEATRDLWAEEDEELTASEAAVADGRVTVEERPEVDLAVVRLDPASGPWSGHRFTGGRHFDGVHPMALHRATDRFTLLLTHGRHHRLTQRYETWVQYRSRPLHLRVDLGPLAERLSAEESGGARWEADAPGHLTPGLGLVDGAESSLDVDTVTALVVDHLATAPPAWDPYTGD
jgi:Family of unknown function (DUF6687)